jgi:hypothetical protein
MSMRLPMSHSWKVVSRAAVFCASLRLPAGGGAKPDGGGADGERESEGVDEGEGRTKSKRKRQEGLQWREGAG